MSNINTINMDIEKQVLLAQQGNTSAFSSLVQSTQNLVSSVALSVVHDRDASEDVAQKAYIAAWQQIKELQQPASFLPWIRQITRNIAKNYLRDNKVTKMASSDEAEGIFENQEDTQGSLERALVEQDIQSKVANIVEALPADTRDIVILYYREEQNTVQVARLLDLSESNVRKILSRVRNNIKESILEQCGEVILSTAPVAGFSSLVTGALMTSSPAAAAATSAASVSSSSIVGKVLALVGGAVLGAFIAIAAVLWSSKKVQARIEDSQQRRLLKNKTLQQVGWIAVSAIMLTASYHIDTTWKAPVIVYAIFVIGLLLQTWQIRQLFNSGQIDVDVSTRKYLTGKVGMLVGAVAGSAGLIIGLINSGRLVL